MRFEILVHTICLFTQTTVMESHLGSNYIGKLVIKIRTDIAPIINEYDSADNSAISTLTTSCYVSDLEYHQEVQPSTSGLQTDFDDHTEEPRNVKTDELMENQQNSKSVKHNIRSRNRQSLDHTVTATKAKNNLHAETLNKVWEGQSKKMRKIIPECNDIT